MTKLKMVLLLLLPVMFLAACGKDADNPSGGDRATSDLVHIHGLGVDPADGAVYAAAHEGLFRLGAGNTATRVGPVQDTMGFTVTGPRTFLASGHPNMQDLGEGAEPHLGLIRSTDAGATWTTVSEAGKADFHSLQQAGENLYAYDSQTGQVRRSTDGGRTWQIGAKLGVIDLAAGEDRPDRVYAATEQGVMVSENAGAAFSALPGAPILVALESTEEDRLIGIGPDGRVRSGPGWEVIGQVSGGMVSAFTAVDDDRLLVATEDGAIQESKDGGKSFIAIFKPSR